MTPKSSAACSSGQTTLCDVRTQVAYLPPDNSHLLSNRPVRIRIHLALREIGTATVIDAIGTVRDLGRPKSHPQTQCHISQISQFSGEPGRRHVPSLPRQP